jgi:hypothetical protein
MSLELDAQPAMCLIGFVEIGSLNSICKGEKAGFVFSKT